MKWTAAMAFLFHFVLIGGAPLSAALASIVLMAAVFATPATWRFRILPGHYRRTMWYFLSIWGLGMAGGVLAFGFGWLLAVRCRKRVLGRVLAFAAFLWMLSTIGRVQSAQCPTCSG